MSWASQPKASLERAEVSAEAAGVACAAGEFDGVPCAASGTAAAEKSIAASMHLRVPRFAISKDNLPFRMEDSLNYQRSTHGIRPTCNALLPRRFILTCELQRTWG